MQIVKICQKIKGQPNFCLLIAMYSKLYTKTALSLYFWADCNHSHAIITRIVSRFRFFSKSKSGKCSLTGVVFKVRNQKLAPVQAIFVGF